MDDKWFKSQQRRAGVTADDIAKKMGRDRSVVSHIYNGRQRMSMDWAKAFADVLGVDLAEIMRRAGIVDEPEAKQLTSGFSESDAAPWVGSGASARDVTAIAGALGGDRAGVDVWTVGTSAMLFDGLRIGDKMLIDTNAAERAGMGDIVIAQIYNWKSGVAQTVLRRYEPPVLVGAGPSDEDRRVVIVDNNNVVIKGRVIASWRN